MGKRILFLISDTGGTHRSAAQALSEVFEEKYGFECLLPDFFKEGTKPPFRKFPEFYADMTKKNDYFYALLWYGIYPEFFYRFLNRIVDFFSPQGLHDFYEKYSPFHCVISCHALFNHFPLLALRRYDSHIPFYIVVVDLLSLHTGWFAKEADFIFLPLPECEPLFLKRGFPRNRLKVCGFPIRREFLQTVNREELRKKLRIGKRKVILIIGGGEGVGRIGEVAEFLIKNTDYEILIVTGRNRFLWESLNKRYDGERVKVFGFVDNMPEILSLADLCITKAGPAIIMEAIAKRVPLILMDYTYGQEAKNIQWVENREIGFYEIKPKDILNRAKMILETELGERIKERMGKIKYFNGAERICAKIKELLG
ncbi:MAG: glycosyltransferase [candidate division WOR-3 bacterium]